MTTSLFIIDPQNDFCDPNSGRLYVPGAEGDMERLSSFIQTHGAEIDDIIISLDSHQRLDISHPLWWTNAQGEHPTPFTVMTASEVEQGVWRTVREADAAKSKQYVEALAAGNRYPHVIWPEHCLVGHPGHNLWPALHDVLGEWEAQTLTRVHYVYKGTNPYTEHFSAIRAEVPDPNDPATLPNEALLNRLADADTLLIAGEARSHCVANSVRDLVALRPQLTDRLVLLEDTTSDVPSFESLGTAFVSDLSAMGMRCIPTTEWRP